MCIRDRNEDYFIKKNVPEGQECYNAAAELAEQGCNIIFCLLYTSFPAYYTVLCARVADAIDALEQQNYGAAKDTLISGMQEAEEIILAQRCV